MAKRKKVKQSELQRLTVTKVEFRLPNPGVKKRAQMLINYEKKLPDDLRLAEVKIPLVSVWRDPNTNNACKAFAIAPTRATHKNLHLYLFFKDILRQGYAVCGEDMILSCDQDGLLRYGIKHRSSGMTAFYQKYDYHTMVKYYIYDSKTIALRELILRIGEIIPVGGLDLINLNVLPSSILLEAGMTYIPDLLKRGVGMWMGSLDTLFRMSHIPGWEREKGKEKVAKKLLMQIDQALRKNELQLDAKKIG